MPLLGTKIFQPAEPLDNVGASDKVYTIPHTKEQFKSKGEFDKRCTLYKEPVWTCQCTGQIKLTHAEAWKSEQEIHRQIKAQFPKYCEKPVLEFVHHSTDRLEELVVKTWTALHQAYMVGEPVKLKVKAHGKDITGKIIKIDRAGIEHPSSVNNCNSPSSDKENKGGGSSTSGAESPRKFLPPKLLSYKYAMKLDHDEKVISGIPANDIERITRPPAKDLMRLFIRASAVRFGVQSTSPWLVDETLVKKYNIPSRCADALVSPQKMAEISKKAEEEILKKRQDSAKKHKLLRSPSSREKRSPRKQTQLSFSKKVTPKKTQVICIDSDSDSSSDDDVILADVKRRLDSDEDFASKAKKRKRHSSSSSSDSDVVLAAVKKKLKSPTKNKRTPQKIRNKNESTPSKSKKNAKSPSKSDGKKRGRPRKDEVKKNMKQMTLFELSKKLKARSPRKGTPTRSPKRTPQKAAPTPPRTPRIAGKIRKALGANQKGMAAKLAIQAAKQLSAKQRDILPPDVKHLVLEKFEQVELKRKLAMMTPEEREAFKEERMKQKREESRKLRLALNKRFEDIELDLKPLPTPKLVPTPDGLPNECFGDVALVTEFISCYKCLLMPDDKESISADALMKGLTAGPAGFTYITRLLTILLQTLLQDEISEDYKELKLPLTEIPVNVYTASELLRLVLRKNDPDQGNGNHADDDDEEEEDVDDVPEELLEQLETTEFYELEPKQKLEVIVCLCHRILGSYSVQDYMEEKQKESAKFWRKKMAQYKENKEKRLQQQEKAKGDGETPPGGDGENKVKENGQDEAPTQNGLTLTNFYGKSVEDQAADDSDDLISNVKKRRHAAARLEEKKAREKKAKEDRIRRDKEYEEFKKQRDLEIFEKEFEEAIQLAKTCLRHQSIGTDRHHSRYWLFKGTCPGLYVEKGWVNKEINYSTRKVNNDSDFDSDSDMDDASSTISQSKKNDPRETTFPHFGQNLWFVYPTIEEIDAFLASLHPQGIRESQLKSELKKKYKDILKNFNAAKKVAEKEKEKEDKEKEKEEKEKEKEEREKEKEDQEEKEKKGEENGRVELLTAFREELFETEVKLRNGGLGGVESMEKWGEKLMSSSERKALGECLIEVQSTVQKKFREGIFVNKKSRKAPKNEETGEQEEDEKIPVGVIKWTEAVQSAQTMSRLHTLLGMLDACIKWEKSAENAKCRICRKKSKTNDELLLCDECNQPFHLFCLRPALLEVPNGDWFCPACMPSHQRRRSRVIKRPYRAGYSSDEDGDSDDDEATEVEREDNCAMCGGDEGLIVCSTCPNAFHLDCHDPPLRHPPRGRWECNPCRTGIKLRKVKKPIEARLRPGRQTRNSRKQAKSSSEEESESSEEEDDDDDDEKEEEEDDDDNDDDDNGEEEEEQEESEYEPNPKPTRAGRKTARPKKLRQSSSDEDYTTVRKTTRPKKRRQSSSDEDYTTVRKTTRPKKRRQSSSDEDYTTVRKTARPKKRRQSSSDEDYTTVRKTARPKKRRRSSSDEDYTTSNKNPRGARKNRSSGASVAKKPVNIMHLEEITIRLIRHRSSWAFREPVDIADVPDYYDIIARPIDLETIKAKCAQNEYSSADTYVEDMMLLFNNAQEYNKKESEIYQCMVTVEKYFVDLLHRFVSGYSYSREYKPTSRKR